MRCLKFGLLVLTTMVATPNVYAANIYTSQGFNTRLGAIDADTGVGADIGPYGLADSFQVSGAFDMDGTFFTVALSGVGGDNPQTQLATVDMTTGAATLIGSPSQAVSVPLEVDASNTMYTIGFVSPEFGLGGEPTLYTIDKSTGQLTTIGNTGVTRAMDLAFRSDGTLWVVGGADGGNRLYTVDVETGASTYQTSVTGVVEATGVEGAEIMGIMFDEHDTLFATSFFGGSPEYVSPLFTIDTSTGATTVVGDTGFVNPHGGDTLLPPPTPIYTSQGFNTRLGRINSATGTSADVGPYGLADSFQVSGAFDMDGIFYTVALSGVGGDNPATQLATVDTTTGTATLVGSPTDAVVVPLEVDANNTMYTMGFVSPEFGLAGEPILYTVDKSTGHLDAIGDTGIIRAMDLAFRSDGTLWVVGGADGGNRLYTIDVDTGASTFQADITGVVEATGVEGAEIMGIMFDENDNLLATSFFGGSPEYVSPLFAIDTSTGAATVVGNTEFVNPHGGDTLLLPPQLQVGDADQDLDFDQFDLIQVQQAAKYLTGQPATWGEGDWNGAPGGRPGKPPEGDGVFDQQDIVAAQQGGQYLSGQYAAVKPNGRPGDVQTSVGYNASTGEVFVDASAGTELSSINIDSASGIFTGDAAQNLGGSFDNDADDNIFKATFGDSFGSLSFGRVAQAGLSEEFVLSDLTVVGSLAGGGDLGEVDLVYVPEPTSALLLALGLVIELRRTRRPRRRS